MAYVRSRNRLVAGVGVNDAPFKCSNNSNPIYRKWCGILSRCYNSKVQEKCPTYKGCTVDDRWLYFMGFYSWYKEQDPPEGWQLDKDILYKGNKVYSPDTCVFVPRELNLFVNDHVTIPSKHLRGVIFDPRYNVYKAYCRDIELGKKKYLGDFKDKLDAHNAYREHKWKQAQIWIERIENDDRFKKKEQLIQSITERCIYQP